MAPLDRIRTFLRLPSDIPIQPEVRKVFKRNFISNTLDMSFWILGESFVSVSTILPVFASTMTDSAILIGLVPALINAGWFIPQLFLADKVKRLPDKLPFAKSMAIVERVPFAILPLTAFLLNWVPKEIAIWIFLVAVAWRGFASGMIALPWQEVIATVIPAPVRSRFFGVSRMIGRSWAVIGSAAAGFILAHIAYPNNFALSFLIGAVFVWISYIFFSRTVAPKPTHAPRVMPPPEIKGPLIDIKGFRAILQHDTNFRKYLVSRIFYQISSMASAFLAIFGIQRFNLADEQAAVFSALLFGSSIFGFLFWGLIGDRRGPRNILLIADFLQVVVLGLSILAPSIWVFYLAFFIFGLAQSGAIVGDMVLGMSLGPEEERPVYLGLARTLPGVFVLFAPLLGGFLAERIGYESMFLIATAFAILGVIFLVQVHNPRHTA